MTYVTRSQSGDPGVRHVFTRAITPAGTSERASAFADIEAAAHCMRCCWGSDPTRLRAEFIEAAAASAIPASPPTVRVGLPSDLLRRPPDIRVAERQLAAATAHIGVATADMFSVIIATAIGDGSTRARI